MYSLYRVWHSPKWTFVPVILNFTVHAVMYTYYCLMSLQKTNILPKAVNNAIKAVCNAISIFITAMQLAQMFIALSLFSLFAEVIEPEFGLDMLGIAMYGVYAFYFASLFLDKYVFKTHKVDGASKTSTAIGAAASKTPAVGGTAKKTD